MDKLIRILHVFGRLDRGGAETLIMNLYRNIDRTKTQFDFVVHTEDKCAYDDEIYSLGGRIYRMPRYTGKNHFQYKKAWNKFFKDHSEYKIIHGHVRSTASIYLRIANKYGLTTIAHSHSTSSGKGFQAIVKNIFQYPIRYIADYLFACSKEAGEWLFGKSACQSDNFYILKNAIDVEKFSFKEEVRAKKRKQLNVEDKFVVGHIGRFCEPKNHKFIIEIFKEIYDKKYDSVLLLVGDGELRGSIEKKVRDLGLSNNVIFTGVRSDVPELLQAMDVFVFPSLYEGLPVTLIEAQAAGLPCVVSDVITRELAITPYLKYISLDLHPKIWAEKALLPLDQSSRYNCASMVAKAGFSIIEVAHELELWYLKKYNLS